MSREDPQIKLRLPEALRDRIKVYAEAHGRSMNAEILRILEREFPEPVDMSARMGQLVELIKIIEAGKGKDTGVDTVASLIEDTIQGIVTGRVRGVNEDARRSLELSWGEYQSEQAEYDEFNSSLDVEESISLERGARTAKYVWPDGEIGPEENYDPFFPDHPTEKE